MAVSLEAGRLGLRGQGPPSLTRPHPGFSSSLPSPRPPLPPPFPPAHPKQSGFLTWSRLGLQLPDVPSTPTGHGSRPARPASRAQLPAWSACTQSWKTWVSGARVSLSPAPHHPLNPLPHTRAPLQSPHASPHPCLCLASGLCCLFLCDSTARFLPLPSCLSRAGYSLPSCFTPLHHWLQTDGQGGAVAEGAWAQRLWDGRG